ncbi:carbohydrate ABC transporter permease [Microbacterium sp. DT81.1]|uniref:carbohydrate ABC transporter permease n=1 Tax=Microbacterium sp. DT81.1 TaxID=3393413 RepID=UPI003CEB8CCA
MTITRPARDPLATVESALEVARTRPAARRKLEHPWLFIVPAFAVLVVFFFTPTLLNMVYPFTDWSAFKSEINFVGLDNFRRVIEDGSLFAALRITLTYAVLVAIFQNLFGLGLAVLLERDTILNRIARALFFLPVLISALAGGYIAQAMLKPDGGLNQILGFLFGRDVAVAWLGSTTWTIVVVALVHGWKWMGLAMLVFLAGLKSVPSELIEAARIDGASPWQIFRNIKFPLLAPAVTFNVATALIGTLNGFDIVQATTGGGPARSTEVLNIFIFRTFGSGLYAQASTMSLVLFLCVVAIAIPLITYLRRRERVLA